MISKGPVLTKFLKSIPYSNTFIFFVGKFLQILKKYANKRIFQIQNMFIEIPPQKLKFLLFIYVRFYDVQQKRKYLQPVCIFFRGQNLAKFKEDVLMFWFKMSLSKFLHISYIILAIVKLQGPNLRRKNILEILTARILVFFFFFFFFFLLVGRRANNLEI